MILAEAKRLSNKQVRFSFCEDGWFCSFFVGMRRGCLGVVSYTINSSDGDTYHPMEILERIYDENSSRRTREKFVDDFDKEHDALMEFLCVSVEAYIEAELADDRM